MPNFVIPKPTRLEKLLWKIPKYGQKRHDRYIRKYFITCIHIVLNTDIYGNNPHSTIMNTLFGKNKLSINKFQKIEDCLLEYFTVKLSISLSSQVTEFLRSNQVVESLDFSDD